MEKILIIKKKPGQEPEIEPAFENSLSALQEAVGGYIETVTFASNACVVCNEEGLLLGLPYNCNFLGCDFYGTILIVGVKGENFSSLRSATIPQLMKALKG